MQNAFKLCFIGVITPFHLPIEWISPFPTTVYSPNPPETDLRTHVLFSLPLHPLSLSLSLSHGQAQEVSVFFVLFRSLNLALSLIQAHYHTGRYTTVYFFISFSQTQTHNFSYPAWAIPHNHGNISEHAWCVFHKGRVGQASFQVPWSGHRAMAQVAPKQTPLELSLAHGLFPRPHSPRALAAQSYDMNGPAARTRDNKINGRRGKQRND